MGDTSKPFRVMSLCSGGAGLDDGVRRAVPAARVVCWVEWEAFAVAELVRRMEAEELDAAPCFTDLKRLDGRPWRGAVDAVVGGFPCQPHSTAGKRVGEADERNLWPDVRRIVGEVEPRVVYFENVPGIVTISNGRFFKSIVEDLERMGYAVAACLLSAESVGAPHRRMRLFILGVMGDSDRPKRRGRNRLPRHLAAAAGSELERARGVFHAPGDRRRQDQRDEPAADRGGAATGHAADAVEPVGDAVRDGGGGCDGQGGGGRGVREASDDVGDAGVPEPAGLRGRASEFLARSGVPGGELVNADDPRPQGRHQPVGGDGDERTAGAGSPTVGLPAPFPPRPGQWEWVMCADGRGVRFPRDGDAAAWCEVLAVRPELAPALPKSALRLLADGLADDRSRYLKLLGNGVVPVCAEAAYRVLWDVLERAA